MAVAETAARKVLSHGGRGVAATFSFGLDGLWHRVASFVPHLIAALAGEAHDLVPKWKSLWQWVQSAAVVALPYYVLGAAAVLLVVALVWFFGAVICAATVCVCRALVLAVCYLARGLYYVGAAAALLLAPCVQCMLHCCTVVTMRAPGAAGWLISRAAFEAAPALYFTILRAGGAAVATAVFCARPVAWALAAPVPCLFRVRA